MGERVGINGDIAGGAVTSIQNIVKINGVPVIVLGSPVAPHGEGPHIAASMIEGKSFFRANGVPICANGNKASCGDSLNATGFVEVEGI